jgi:hypothetical protein
MPEKLKRGTINDDGEIEDVEIDDGYQIPGDSSDFPLFKFVGGIIGLIVIFILLAIAISTINSNADKTPNPFNMLRGCFSLIHDKAADGKDANNNSYYLSSTVNSAYSDCISKTELQPYSKETDQALSVEVVASYAVGCVGSKLEPWQLEDKYKLDEFATCMKNNNIGWRQVKVTPEATGVNNG